MEQAEIMWRKDRRTRQSQRNDVESRSHSRSLGRHLEMKEQIIASDSTQDTSK